MFNVVVFLAVVGQVTKIFYFFFTVFLLKRESEEYSKFYFLQNVWRQSVRRILWVIFSLKQCKKATKVWSVTLFRFFLCTRRWDDFRIVTLLWELQSKKQFTKTLFIFLVISIAFTVGFKVLLKQTYKIARPGFDSRPGASPQCGLRGGRSYCKKRGRDKLQGWFFHVTSPPSNVRFAN